MKTPNRWLVVTLVACMAVFLVAPEHVVWAQSGGSGGQIVRFTDSSANIIYATDNANNAIRVNIVAGAAGGPTHVDDAAFTVASDDGVPIFAMFDDTGPDSVNEGDAGVVRMSANRNMYTTLRDAAGNERGANVNASNQLEVAVGNTVTVSATNLDIRDLTSASDSVTAVLQAVSSANNDGAQVSVTTSSTSVLASFSTRKVAIVCASPVNTSKINLKLGATATTSDGEVFPGQCWNTTVTPYTGAIDAISPSGTQTVTVWEW